MHIQNGTDPHDGLLLPVWLKLIGGLSCLILSIIAALFSRITFFARHPDALSFANIAGGGVILAVAFVHLIPEATEGFSELDLEYPLAFTLIFVGYVLLLLLEKVIFHHGHAHDLVKINHSKMPSDKTHLLVEDEEDDVDIDTQKKNTFITPLALTIALSLHSLFEGIVFGVQSNHSSTLSVMIALICHKPIEILFVCFVMVKEKVSIRIFVLLTLVVAISTPLGIGIGVAITNTEAPDYLFAIFTSLAAGTFIYIGTTEIIAEEFQAARKAVVRWQKIFSLFLGIAVILILKIWLPDPHTHGGEHDHDHGHEECHNETLRLLLK